MQKRKSPKDSGRIKLKIEKSFLEKDHIPLIIIGGPTASGKSKLAMRLGEIYPIEIINGDSVQVYDGMDIGTAKPSKKDQEKIRHHLFDIIQPKDRLTVFGYMELARKKAKEIAQRKKIPIIVGGSPFYLDAVVFGLDSMPSPNPRLRKLLDKYREKNGPGALFDKLSKLDPNGTEGIERMDDYRAGRRIEIILSSGKAWEKRAQDRENIDMQVKRVVLSPERKELYQRIDNRVDLMIKGGFLEEIEGLLKKYPPHSPGFSALGYKQLLNYFAGERELNGAVDAIKTETRHFAKRQMTWFKKWEDGALFCGSCKQVEESAFISMSKTLDHIVNNSI